MSNKESRRKKASRKNIIPFIVLGILLAWLFPCMTQIVFAVAQGPVLYCDCIIEDEAGERLRFPSSVFIDTYTKEIYITDGMNRIIVYTSDFFPIFTLDKKRGIESPQGLTIDSQGNLYIVQSATKEVPNPRISIFNACYKWIKDISLTGFEGADTFIPSGLATDRTGNIYVAGSSFPGVLILGGQGTTKETLSHEENGKMVQFNNVTVDSKGRIYLVSEINGHIYVFDENRKFLFEFGEKGGSSGKLSRPQTVAIDERNGTIYVVDYMRHTVSAYDSNGKYLHEFGGLGWGEGWLQFPRDIAVDSEGRILVADTFNDRIEIFKPNE
jgi:DNA-binding beta-propeller fold protein YncE